MTPEDIERRIRALEDLEAIKQLHREYAFLVTSEKWEELIDFFAEDAIADIRIYGPRIGKADIAKLFREIIVHAQAVPGVRTPRGGHFLSMPVITVNGDKAKGSWLMDRCFDDVSEPGAPRLSLTKGRYDCTYVKENGRWKFSYLKWTHPWPPEG